MAKPYESSPSHWRLKPIHRDAGRSRTQRRYLIVALAAVLLAALGALFGLLFYLNPYTTPRFLPLVLHEYEAEFPLRAWARQDAEALRDLQWTKKPDTLTSQQRGPLKDLLERQKEAKEPLVVYLSAYIAANARKQGEPCLLAVDDRLDDPNTWIPLADVFKALGESSASHKLVLIDVMQPLTLPRQGLLRSDAADLAFPAIEKAAKEHPSLQILCACSPGQVSHTSDELGQSVFAYFVTRGLRGRANLTRDGAQSKRVTSTALIDYVKRQVDGWTLLNLGERQTPVALNVGDEFDVTDVLPEPDHASALPETYPDWLKAGWQRHDRWWGEGAHRRSPRLVAGLGDAVLQAELRWRGGLEETRVRGELSAHLERFERQRGRLPAPTQAAGLTLTQTLDRDKEQAKLADEESATLLRQLAARRDALAREKNDKEKPNEAKVNSLTADVAEFAKKFKGKPLALAWLACEVPCDHPVGPEGFRLFGDFLETIEVPGHEEVAFLKRMAARAGQRPGDWSAEVAQLAMQTSRESARAGTASEEALRWIDHLLDQARSTRARAERLLFDTNGRWDAAAPAVRKALDLYRGINRERAIVEEAARGRDEGMAWLPGFVGAVELDDNYTKAWLDAAESTRKLRKTLETPVRLPGDGKQAAIDQLERVTEDLQKGPNSLYSLRRLVEPTAFRALMKQRNADGLADGRTYQALLATTWPGEPQRQQLWAEYRAQSRNRHETTLADFAPPRPKLPDLTEWGEAERTRGRDKLLQRDLTRAKRSLSRLRLVSDQDTTTITELLAKTEADRNNPARWTALAEGLRQAWAKARTEESP